MNRVYLDNNASTRIYPEVAAAIDECYSRGYVNPASQHAEGRQARKALEAARDEIGRILGVRLDTSRPDRVLFTSGGTESNNLALRGLTGRFCLHRARDSSRPPTQGPRLIVSSIEHPSIAETATHLGHRGLDVWRIPVDSNGVLQLTPLGDRLSANTICVSAMLGNHETGVLQPIQKIVAMCDPLGIPVHTDAVQVVGKMPISFRELNVTALTVSAHKFHGPRGIGVLVVRHEADLEPVLTGGSQQRGTRPGTESVALAVGMCRALQLWKSAEKENESRMRSLRERLESRLRAHIPNVVIHGQTVPRLPHTTNFSIPGLDRQAMLLALDRAGVACSTGSACTSGSSEPSPVLIAMGCDEAIIEGSLRLSLCVHTTKEEIDLATTKIVETYQHLAPFPVGKKYPLM